ncbi:MAG: CynX/NimT family MFS transporter [Moorellales bacterium]
MTEGEAYALLERRTEVGTSSWLPIWVAFAAGVAAAASQNQIPPMAPLLRSSLNLSPLVMGLVMSSFGIAGAVLGIPAGIVMGRRSLKKLALLGMLALVIGNLVPLIYFSAAGIVVGRIVGGVGFALVAVAAPSIVSHSAPPEKRGLAMGIWAAWVPVGTLAIFNLTPWLARVLSARGVWGFCLVLCLAAALAMYFLAPEVTNPEEVAKEPSSERASIRRPGGPNLSLIYVNAAFLVYAGTMLSVTTWFPTFLVQVRSLSLATATLIGSLASLGALVGCPLAGHLYDRYRSSRLICGGSSATQAVLYLLIFHLAVGVVPVVQFCVGLIGSMVPTVVFAAIPHLARQAREVPLGLGLALTAQNGGLILGPTLTGWILDATGSWNALALAISLACAFTAALWVFLPIEAQGRA